MSDIGIINLIVVGNGLDHSASHGRICMGVRNGQDRFLLCRQILQKGWNVMGLFAFYHCK